MLTNEMILEFVDRILVHGPRRVGGMKIQPVEIMLKHIGKVDLPEEEPPVPLTEEELAAEKRRRRQEYDRRYYFEKRTGRRIVSEDGVFFKGAADEGVHVDPVADATAPSPQISPSATGSFPFIEDLSGKLPKVEQQDEDKPAKK